MTFASVRNIFFKGQKGWKLFKWSLKTVWYQVKLQIHQIRLNESESLFLFLAILGKVVLLRSGKGKLMTGIKWGKLSELSKYFYAKIPLWGWKGYVVSEWGSHVLARLTPITVWVNVLNNESNCLLKNRIVSTLISKCIRLLSLVQSYNNILHVISRENCIWKVFWRRSAAYNAHPVSKMSDT